MIIAGRLAFGGSWRLVPRSSSLTARRSAHTFSLADAYSVLGLPDGSARKAVKQAYFELAKKTHPDIVSEEQDEALPTFLELSAAFEVIEEHTFDMEAPSLPGTAANAAARGSDGRARTARTSSAARAAARARSLGEVLCDRLAEDPELARLVWDEIRERKLRVVPTTLDRLFRACAEAAAQRGSDDGLTLALAIMREASQDGLLTPSLREAALVSVIKWCKRDRSSFEEIYASIDEQDLTASTMETVSYANFLYSGAWDGYSSGR